MSRRHFSALAALAIVAALAVTLLTPERMGREDAPRREWLLGDLESRINDTREVVVRVAGDELFYELLVRLGAFQVFIVRRYSPTSLVVV